MTVRTFRKCGEGGGFPHLGVERTWQRASSAIYELTLAYGARARSRIETIGALDDVRIFTDDRKKSQP